MRIRPFALLAAAAVFFVGPAAHAGTVTIDFNGLGGADNSVFTTYTEYGFTVADTSGTFRVANAGGNNFGDPEPDIYTDSTGTVTITDGGQPFSFDSFDLGFFNAGTTAYTVTGILGGVNAFVDSGSASDATRLSFVLVSGFSSDQVTSVTLDLTSSNTNGANIDNISVSTGATPEPSSAILLCTGLLGIALVVRKRFA
jgi:hypothetical protein